MAKLNREQNLKAIEEIKDKKVSELTFFDAIRIATERGYQIEDEAARALENVKREILGK